LLVIIVLVGVISYVRNHTMFHWLRRAVEGYKRTPRKERYQGWKRRAGKLQVTSTNAIIGHRTMTRNCTYVSSMLLTSSKLHSTSDTCEIIGHNTMTSDHRRWTY